MNDSDAARPPVVEAGAAAVVDALGSGAIVAVPNVGGYSLAVRAGSSDDEARLVELAADPDGPHYAVGQIDDVRALTSGWTDELGTLLQRCWPGPVEVFLPWAGGAGHERDADVRDGAPADPDGVTADGGAAERCVRPRVVRPRVVRGQPSWGCPTGGPCAASVASRARGGPSRSVSTRPRRSHTPSVSTTWLSWWTAAGGRARSRRWWTRR